MFKYIKQWFMEGWEEGKTKLYPPSQVVDHTIEEEIAVLEIIIERRKQAATILEHELITATGRRKITIINQLNTMDKQTYKDIQRLNQLRDG